MGWSSWLFDSSALICGAALHGTVCGNEMSCLVWCFPAAYGSVTALLALN